MSKKIIIGMLLSVLILGQLTMVSSASATGVNNGIEYFVNYAEPATSDYEGYLSLLLENTSTGEKVTNTFFWYSCAVSNGVAAPSFMCLNIDSGTVVFNPGGNAGATGAYYSLSQWSEQGRCGNVTYSSSSSYTWSFSRWGYRILGYKYSGNVGNVSVSGVNNDANLFTIFFATDGSSILLMDILSELQSMKNIDSSIWTTVQNILSSVDDVESQLSALSSYLRSAIDSIGSKLSILLDKADKIIEEQEESNTWLEKIYNFLEEKDEKDKEQAQTQGNTSVSQGTASIEDKGAGFANSMGGLVSSMSYNGTQCAWTFPEVRLPAIAGVMEERVLIEEQPIDFSVWINAIPAPILLLIQSLLTMGLIVYCFKELYGTISYVLTLRGGGSNE